MRLTMRLTFALLTAALLTIPLHAQRGNPSVAYEGQSVDAMIAAFMAEHHVDGMSLAIVQAPYITRATGYGLADPARRTLVSTNTMFDIGQMKDAFTAVAVMQLAEMGKLRVGDTAGSILGNDDARTMRALLHDAAAYATLEKIVAKASGMTYEQFVRLNQFEPLGLRHTTFESDLTKASRERFEPGERHRHFLSEAAFIDPTEPAVARESSTPLSPSIYSSASDISFWDIALAGDVLINDPELRKILYVPPVENGVRSLREGAWAFPGREGLMITTGSANGFSSLLSRYTKSDELLCVTLLANREGLDLGDLARRIAAAFDSRLATLTAR